MDSALWGAGESAAVLASRMSPSAGRATFEELTRKDARGLRDGNRVNDEVVNAYRVVLEKTTLLSTTSAQSDSSGRTAPNVHVFNSWFMSKLYTHNRRYTGYTDEVRHLA